MSQKHTSSIVRGAGFLATFNHQLFAGLEKAGLSDEQIYGLLKADDPEVIRRVVEVFVRSVEPVSSVASAKTLAEMLDRGQYAHVHDLLTEKNFQADPRLFSFWDCRLIPVSRGMKLSDVVSQRDIAHRKSYEFASIERLLAFGAKYPVEQLRCPILSLSSCCGFRGYRVGYPCLTHVDGARMATVKIMDCGHSAVFDEDCRILVRDFQD